jgi:hypothetical protein
MVPCLDFKPLDLLSRDLMFIFIYAQKDFVLRIPVHPTRLHRRHVFSPLRRDFISTSSPTRRSGLVRHGYPWVPTDQGPRGPCQVDPTCQKPSRPASGLGDLVHSPNDLGRPRMTLSRSRMTCRACGASYSLDHGGGAASRPGDREIHSVITEGDLPKFVTNPNEGTPTSNGNPSPPAI